MDYLALRNSTLDSGVAEEAVTVNTRALIDKVLARYSGEFTTLRELLQNAADAGASRVEIRFDTVPVVTSSATEATEPELGAQPTVNEDLKRRVKSSKFHRLLVRNDGFPFREEDWKRLKSIAEGNPDETKIGAFGVGFYSVFSECEEPFVSSGSDAMAFYWKGNQLFTRRAKVAEPDGFTTFLLDYRTPTEPPALDTLCQFLATSLTFISLKNVELRVDDYLLCSISKVTSPAAPLAIPSNFATQVPRGNRDFTMRIAQVVTESVQLHAEVMNIVNWKEKKATSVVESVSSVVTSGVRGFWSRFSQASAPQPSAKAATSSPVADTGNDLSKVTKSTIFLRVATAQLDIKVPSNFAKELERATKKPPPRRTSLAILTMSKEELMASDVSAPDSESFVFANILPTKLGKIFIGFPTHQTTAIRAHFAAHSLIPTVERESIDFNARWVREWNASLLRAAGVLARVMFFNHMSLLSTQRNAKPGSDSAEADQSFRKMLEDSTVHIMKMFDFGVESTPSAVVGQLIQESFWDCSNSIEVLSNKGILPSKSVRYLPDGHEDMAIFLEGLPLLSDVLRREAAGFVRQLLVHKLIEEVSFLDVKRELENHALSGATVEKFLSWLAKKRLADDLPQDLGKELLDAAIATSPDIVDSSAMAPSILQLQHVRTYVNSSRIPPGVPVPNDCIPFHFTKNLKKEELNSLGWRELDLVNWVEFVSKLSFSSDTDVQYNMALSPKFSERVLSIISKSFDSLSNDAKTQIVQHLRKVDCIPTSRGMKAPDRAYFSTVKVFSDLPILSPLMGVKEKFLVALGVRKTLELSLVLERLSKKQNDVGEGSSWSHYDLIKYFTGVKEDIPKEDFSRLLSLPFCKKEGEGKDNTLYKASSLFAPNDDLKKLGCPIIEWPNGAQGWKKGALPEEKFVLSLGLKPYPDVNYMLHLMSTQDDSSSFRETALNYFVVNYHANGYNKWDLTAVKLAILPTESDSSKHSAVRLYPPTDVYTDPRVKILGFPILRADLRDHADKFGVAKDPPISKCINRLIASPPRAKEEAERYFSYFASRLVEISPQSVDLLATSNIVPLAKNGRTRMVAPVNCFLGGSNSQYKDVFDFVDFGDNANPFLRKCGTQLEPSISQIAWMLTTDADRMLISCQSNTSKYLSILRNLADAYPELKKDKPLIKSMKKAKFLIGNAEPTSGSSSSTVGDPDEDDDARIQKEARLASAEDITTIDDIVLYNIFRGSLLACPQEDALENFYASLGAQSLSKKIQADYRVGRLISNPSESKRLRDLCLERCALFFHNNNSAVRRDSKWLSNHLEVVFVESISLKRTLYPQMKTHIQKTGAALSEDGGDAVLQVSKSDYNMYDIAQQLMRLMLQRPKPHYTLLLESLLNTDVYVLKARGYNVDRILRKKEKEAIIAEQQRRELLAAQEKEKQEKQRLEKEQHEREKAELQTEQKHLQQGRPGPQSEQEKASKTQTMPGSFHESPPNSPPRGPTYDPLHPAQSGKPRKTLLSSLTKSLGIGSQHDDSQKTRRNGPSGQTPRLPTEGDGSTTSPETLQRTLREAISASKAWNSNEVFTRPDSHMVKEQESYCDSTPAKDITLYQRMENGMDVYMPRTMSDADKGEFWKLHAENMKIFGTAVIRRISNAFEMKNQALSIFYDPTRTIAFNIRGSLFCNFFYYLKLHSEDCRAGNTNEALIYWFVVLCHELAHNLVSDHSAAHSFYTETFVQQYFSRVALMAIPTR